MRQPDSRCRMVACRQPTSSACGGGCWISRRNRRRPAEWSHAGNRALATRLPGPDCFQDRRGIRDGPAVSLFGIAETVGDVPDTVITPAAIAVLVSIHMDPRTELANLLVDQG